MRFHVALAQIEPASALKTELDNFESSMSFNEVIENSRITLRTLVDGEDEIKESELKVVSKSSGGEFEWQTLVVEIDPPVFALRQDGTIGERQRRKFHLHGSSIKSDSGSGIFMPERIALAARLVLSVPKVPKLFCLEPFIQSISVDYERHGYPMVLWDEKMGQA